jgi:hypothetical protein
MEADASTTSNEGPEGVEEPTEDLMSFLRQNVP